MFEQVMPEASQIIAPRRVPWTQTGQSVNGAMSAAEAIKASSLNWQVIEKPIYHHLEGENKYKLTPGYKALIRDDLGTTLSVMKNSYGVLQNDKAFQFFDQFVQAGLAKFETAGSLRDGKVIWILAKLNKDPIIIGKDDEVEKYLLLSNSHNGTLSATVCFTPIRVACKNTLYMALAEAESANLIRVRHSHDVAQRIEDIQNIINIVDASFTTTANQYQLMAKTEITDEGLREYIGHVFKFQAAEDIETERERLRQENIATSILTLFNNGAGQYLKGATGKWWGAYNAVTEYLTHESSKKEETRLYGNWFGESKRTNKRAFEYAINRSMESVMERSSGRVI